MTNEAPGRGVAGRMPAPRDRPRRQMARRDCHPTRRTSPPATERRARGQSTVEFALILPVALALLVVIADAGRLFFTYLGVVNAAREGAAFGMRHPTCWSHGTGTNQCPDPGNITYLARGEMGGDTSLVVTVACSSSCAASSSFSGNLITVTTTRPFHLIVPLFGDLTLGASSTAVIQ